MMKAYRVLVARWIGNAYRKVGDEVSLTDGQAKYLMMAGGIEPVQAKKSSTAKKTAAKETDVS
jgi:hypothetical protein